MKKFNTFEEYVDITKMAQLAKMKNINCYLFADEIKNLIKKEQLHYIINDTTLEIFVKHERYLKCYFYGKDDFSFVKPEGESLPIITDIAYSLSLKEKDLFFKQKLEGMNFNVNATSSRMASKTMDCQTKFVGFKVEKAKTSYVNDILRIWEENFDPIQNLLYDKKEIEENIDSIYVLKNSDNCVVGAMQIVLNSKSGIIQHVAISKEYQRKGLGSILEIFYINYCKMLGINTLLLYTIDDNFNAQNFHKKFGFDFDGKHNIQMIYRSWLWKN